MYSRCKDFWSGLCKFQKSWIKLNVSPRNRCNALYRSSQTSFSPNPTQSKQIIKSKNPYLIIDSSEALEFRRP